MAYAQGGGEAVKRFRVLSSVMRGAFRRSPHFYLPPLFIQLAVGEYQPGTGAMLIWHHTGR